MTFDFTPSDVARFLKFVEKLPNGCWFWSGARSRGKGNKKWYGSFRVGGKVIRAHRFACEALANPPKLLQPGEHRDHTCCFSLCVNPNHLDIVTHARNEELKKERMSGAVVASFPSMWVVQQPSAIVSPHVAGVFPKPCVGVGRCHADRDGKCFHQDCPQILDGEPKTTGRHCPIVTWKGDDCD